jgi:hypothetical protein
VSVHELAGSQGWRNLRCLRQAMGESIPSVYRLRLLLDARGQGRRNERRCRFCARAAVQPSAVRARGEQHMLPNSSSQTDAMADQPRQPAGFLKTCNTDGSVFFQESPAAAYRKVHRVEKQTLA